jgi:hypothetical protein
MTDTSPVFRAAITALDKATVPPRLTGPDGCPILPLGHWQGRYFFLDPLTRLIILSASRIGHGSVARLFGTAGSEWLQRRFPAAGRRGFDVDDCWSWLVARCARAGLLDLDRPWERAHGVGFALGDFCVEPGGKIVASPLRFFDPERQWPNPALSRARLPRARRHASAEAAWLSAAIAMAARPAGRPPPATFQQGGPDAIVVALDRAYRRSDIGFAHARILRIYGWRGTAPHNAGDATVRDMVLWSQAMTHLDRYLRNRGII